jgi:hypothetical protein
MSASIAIASALGSATSAAVASALQHRSASSADRPAPSPTGGLAGFARSQLTHRLWWTALPVQIIGLVLHATALSGGALALVQPLLVCSVVLALPMHHFLNREPVTVAELAWSVLLVAGIGGFLTISAASTAPAGTGAGGSGAVLAVLVGLAAVTGCWLAARRARPVPAAALLGAAAAIAFTSQAAFLQATTAQLHLGLPALLTGLPLYGLLATGTAGVVLTQLAFRAGPLTASLPTITVLNPVLGIAVGVLVDHETLRHSPLALAGELVSLILLCVAAVALTYRDQRGRPAPVEPAPTHVHRC